MSFFRYPGGKSKVSTQIIAKIKELSKDIKGGEYREPFFGGGSIGLKIIALNAFDKYWINDKDIGICNLWNALIGYHDLLKDKVMAFKPSTEAFYDFKECLTGDLTKSSLSATEIGFRKLAIHQISYSGLGTKSGGPLGGQDQTSNYKVDCRWSPKYICKKIDKLHALFLGKNIKCTSVDFSQMIDDNAKAMIYLDPPYYVKGGQLYQHSFGVEDHNRLASSLKHCNNKWLLSYDACPEIYNLYGDWSEADELAINYSINGSRSKTEYLIHA